MIMGSVGRVFSFQISSRLFLGSLLFFVGYTVFSLFILNSYMQLRRSSSQSVEHYTRIKNENTANKKALGRSKQQIALLEGYIRHIEEGTDVFSVAAKKEQARGSGETAEKTSVQAASPEQGANPPPPVDITDMVIQKDGSSMSVSLKLVNVQPGEGAIGGYLHLIACDRRSAPPREWPYPQQKLEKGMPVNFRKGQIFLIQKFKQINTRLRLGTPSESPSGIKVLVYDQSGEIILQKEMEVTHSN